MNNFVLYLLQSGLSISILFVIYWFFLRRDTFYNINRYYLLSALLGSMIFPLFKISIPAGSELANVYMLEEIVVAPTKIGNTIHEKIGVGQLLWLVYFSGMVFFIVRFLHQVFQFLWLVNKHGIIKRDGLNIVVLDKNQSAFSFLNIVFIGKGHIGHPNLDKILQHEKIHIQQHHTIDIILLELVIFLQWFNPVIWLYKKNLKGVHEFLADEGVIRTGYNTLDYQQLLLQQTIGSKFITLSNNFNHSLIKKRFTMMTKTKTKKAALLKMVFIIPFTLFFTLAFTFTFTEKVMAQEEKGDIQAVEQTLPQDPQEEIIFTVVEEMPEFPDGPDAMTKYLSENIKYPENARKNGIQGRVFVTFVVEKTGEITNVKVLRGIGGGCDEESIRVVTDMPAWKPGKQRGEAVRVQFNIPIKYSLDPKETRELEKKTPGSEPPMPYQNHKLRVDTTNKDKPE